MATPIPDNTASFDPALLRSLFGEPSEPLARPVVGVCTDSRRVKKGQLYVALRGEQHDGHAFLPQIAGTAAAAVVERGREVPAGLPAFEVDDTLEALGALAAAHRQRWPGRVVAITGSAGKTTTKELTAAALTACGCHVLRTSGNLNNRIGVPMTLLTIGPEHDMAVIEAGTSMRGEIAALTRIISPDVAIVTGVSVAHTEGIGTLEDVADEKASFYDGLGDDGVAVYFADSAPLRARLPEGAGACLGFGASEDADVRLLGHQLGKDLRMRCSYAVPGIEAPVEVQLAMLGVGPALDAGAALCAVLACQGAGDIPAAVAGLARVAPVPGRLCPVAGPGGSVLIDDTYNANPASMGASLRTLAEAARARGGRAIAVLGDMKELGAESADAHVEVGRQAAAAGVETLIGCGHAMAAAVKSAAAAGVPRALLAADTDEASASVGSLGSGDVVLVKGSRSMRMERVVQALQGGAA